MMQITLNGEVQLTRASISIAELLLELQLAERRVAVEINGEIIPRSRHADHLLQEGDRLEIVHAIGGG